MSGSPTFRHELMAALADRVRVKPRGSDRPAHPPRRSLTKPAFKKLLRPVVARYLIPRIASEVDVAYASFRSEQAELQASQSARIGSLEVNAEMLKAQLFSVNNNLERLAAGVNAMAIAIAPTAGIEGVPDRLAELRERLNAVERRTRNIASAPPRSSSSTDKGGEEAATAGAPTAPIDYVGFERRFRGDPREVQEVTRSRYLELLRGHGPVLDVGCGKGELVEALGREGIAAVGIDLDPAMVDEAQARGLDVRVADLNTFLESQPVGSLGSIISTQVVEHLQMPDLVRFLELSATRLRPGGAFVAETPNPTSLIVLGTHFLLDPTHVRPIHPALMVYLCECAGFRSVELRYFEPARQYHLTMLDETVASPWTAQVNANFTRINDVLFGPQDYAVVARTPG
jgi:2-polyprenyl-3-methyl-5-hydroxy-6-metoxy-1,4-benzoquinol methylase